MRKEELQKMLDPKGFDEWAGTYDQTVAESEEQNEYPFAGYRQMLREIERQIPKEKPSDILDIGFGTGVLTERLYEKGHRIVGIDFSAEMVRTAKAKMPAGIFLQHDFKYGLPKELAASKFDYVISTYALHHLTDTEKVHFMVEILEHLNPDGMMLMGDISFLNEEAIAACRRRAGIKWDESEHYFVYETLKRVLPAGSSYRQVSFCAGLLQISRVD